jgi:hypothetical protein
MKKKDEMSETCSTYENMRSARKKKLAAKPERMRQRENQRVEADIIPKLIYKM